jgi:hypothetical protein
MPRLLPSQGLSIEEVTAYLREAIDGLLAVDLPTAGDPQGARVIEVAV